MITTGGCDLAVREALDLLEKHGRPASFMRIRGFPFADNVTSFIEGTRVLLRRRTKPGCSASYIDLEQKPRRAKDKLRSI